MNLDKETLELMDKRPGKVSKPYEVRKQFCFDRDRAALAYAIWLNKKQPYRDKALIHKQQMELLSMNNRGYVRDFTNTMSKAIRTADDLSRDLFGRPRSRATNAMWEVIRSKMPKDAEVLNTPQSEPE